MDVHIYRGADEKRIDYVKKKKHDKRVRCDVNICGGRVARWASQWCPGIGLLGSNAPGYCRKIGNLQSNVCFDFGEFEKVQKRELRSWRGKSARDASESFPGCRANFHDFSIVFDDFKPIFGWLQTARLLSENLDLCSCVLLSFLQIVSSTGGVAIFCTFFWNSDAFKSFQL